MKNLKQKCVAFGSRVQRMIMFLSSDGIGVKCARDEVGIVNEWAANEILRIYNDLGVPAVRVIDVLHTTSAQLLVLTVPASGSAGLVLKVLAKGQIGAESVERELAVHEGYETAVVNGHERAIDTIVKYLGL